MTIRLLPATAAAAFLAFAGEAAVLHVGTGFPYARPSDAAKAVQDGDTVVIHEGDYHADVCVWRASDLDIGGVSPEKVHLYADGAIAQGKAIWIFTGANVRVSGVTFHDAACPDRNGTGIYLEQGFHGSCEIRRCAFLGNENGVRCGRLDDCELLLDGCLFSGNGAGDGYSHNLYIGDIPKLTMRWCLSDHCRKGHALKSRARETVVENCAFDDGDDGECSYLADFPNGGRVTVSGCTFVQSPKASNGGMVAYGQERNLHPGSRLTFRGNVLENRRRAGARFLVADGIGEDAIDCDDTNIYKNAAGQAEETK